MMNQRIDELPNIITCVKDKKSKIISCNECYAMAAGLDSPAQLKGKTDFDLSWKNEALFFQQIEIRVTQRSCNYINVIEHLNTMHGIKDLLVTKTPLLDKHNKCIGVSCFGLEITGYTLVKTINNSETSWHLGEYFNNEHLTERETEVLKYVIMGYTSKQIGKSLKLSHRTIEYHISILKQKLQCKTKGDILTACAKHGLTYILYDVIGTISQMFGVVPT